MYSATRKIKRYILYKQLVHTKCRKRARLVHVMHEKILTDVSHKMTKTLNFISCKKKSKSKRRLFCCCCCCYCLFFVLSLSLSLSLSSRMHNALGGKTKNKKTKKAREKEKKKRPGTWFVQLVELTKIKI